MKNTQRNHKHVGLHVDVQNKFCNARLCWCKNYGVHRSNKMGKSIYCLAPAGVCWCHNADMWHQARLGFNAKNEVDRNYLENIYQEALRVMVNPSEQRQVHEAYTETLNASKEQEDPLYNDLLSMFKLSNEEPEE